LGILRISPKSRLQLTAPIDQELLNTLLALEQWRQGEPDTLKTQTVNNTAGLQAVILTFQPPTAPPNVDEEWILYAISVRDAAGIDAADTIDLTFNDVITATSMNIWAAVGTTGIITGGVNWTWPGKYLGSVPSFTISEYPTRLKDNGEAWRNVQVRHTATGTIGTRTLVVTAFFRRRPL
jgi:hypothetical protein